TPKAITSPSTNGGIVEASPTTSFNASPSSALRTSPECPARAQNVPELTLSRTRSRSDRAPPESAGAESSPSRGAHNRGRPRQGSRAPISHRRASDTRCGILSAASAPEGPIPRPDDPPPPPVPARLHVSTRHRNLPVERGFTPCPLLARGPAGPTPQPPPTAESGGESGG